MEQYRFFNRDLSWLTFNEQVMQQASNVNVPLLERLNFLGIFSSNLDEFYRVRMPILKALHSIGVKPASDIDADEQHHILEQAHNKIDALLNAYGTILTAQIIPALKEQNIHLLYNIPVPEFLLDEVRAYFQSQVLAFLQPVMLDDSTTFFPENNKLYFIVQLTREDAEEIVLLNIPSTDDLPRFYKLNYDSADYIIFLDDVIRRNLDNIFPNATINGCYSIKITRDAELDLQDDYPGDLSEEIEAQLKKRDLGLATRFLVPAGIPLRVLQKVSQQLNLTNAAVTTGGSYHNLRDLSLFPLKRNDLQFEPWPALPITEIDRVNTLAWLMRKKDLIIHTPYQSYNTILRFFNEAAINPDVQEISVSLYRVASDSKIVNALISAAHNGKSVRVVVELKARFDEANNLKWAKKMKAAGVTIIYSITANKVHAKIALVKTKSGSRTVYSGLLATGNFNESTARFYTDHILLTTNPNILREMELLFLFLNKHERPSKKSFIKFEHFLVAQFNLQTRFLTMIDREIEYAKQGLPAHLMLKMNNLEEKVLISKLYEASQAGVKIELIIRSICCLIPGVKGMSENISIKRIVDRYLEHGRVFIFNNNGNCEVYLGSADWMNRNIYNRIEVCFPVYDEQIKARLVAMVNLQLQDNVQAVMLDENMDNVKIKATKPAIKSQQQLYNLLK